MYNYNHQIACPDDKAIQKFLWSDYFHDSDITDICYDDETVTFDLQCYREAENQCLAKNKILDWKTYLKDERFAYQMLFKGVAYFSQELSDISLIYLNGRFKKTALLTEINQKSKKNYYHFRIQVTGGYMDIIFSQVKVRKKVGRVSYRGCYFDKDAFKIREPYEKIKSIHEKISKDLYEEDFDLFLDLMTLDQIKDKDPEIAKYLRLIMKDKKFQKESQLYAAYLLGYFGNRDDLATLLSCYLNCDMDLPKRHILDAIELINQRMI